MYRVMIIDDEPFIRKRLATKFDWETYHFTVCGEAQNGIEALRLIPELSPDVILLDMKMPGMNGIELMQKLKEEKILVHIIVISAYSDFSYTHSAITYGAQDYILKPLDKEELSCVIQKVKHRLDQEKKPAMVTGESKQDLTNRFLRSFLYSNLIDKQQNPPGIVDIHLHLDYQNYVVLITKNASSTIQIPSSKLKKISGALQQKLDSLGIASAVYCGGSHLDKLFILLGSNTTDFGNLSYITTIKKQIEFETSCPIAVGVSNPCNGFHHINTCFNEALEALNYRTLFHQGCIIPYKKIQTIAVPPIAYSSEQEKAFLTSIAICNWDELQFNIAAFFSSMKSHPDFTFRQAYKQCSELLFLCNRLLASYQCSMDDLFIEDITSIGYLSRNDSFEELEHWFTQVIHQIMNLVSEKKACETNQLIDNIVAYVNANFTEPLTLSDLAEQFYLNKSYLSALFKKRTSTTFLKYLTDLRMGKAVELLTSSHFKIIEIAHLVGYSDEKYFSKLFKKTYNMIPELYRKQSMHR